MRQTRSDFLIRNKKQKHGKKIFTVEEAKKFAKQILGDEKTQPFAIWRSTNDSDSGVTLATVFLQTETRRMMVYRENPLKARAIQILSLEK